MTIDQAIEKLTQAIDTIKFTKQTPFIVAIDGPSGAGKSTIAKKLNKHLKDSTLIQLDDFFSAHIPDQDWDHFKTEEKLDKVFKWQELRAQALIPLLLGKPAQWHSIDFEKGIQKDGTYQLKTITTIRTPKTVIILDGAYSANPKLEDLITLKALIQTDQTTRDDRLSKREDADFLNTWHRRWDPVEKYYFTKVRPKHTYNLTIQI